MKVKFNLFLCLALVGMNSISFAFTKQTDSLSIVLKQLHIDIKEVKKDLCIQKVLPYNKELSVWVISKYSVSETGEYDEEYFKLDAYILITENRTGKIISKFIEPNAWIYEAVWKLSSIEIDTAPYIVAQGKRGFGIKTNYEGASRANPSSNSYFSLFLQEGAILKRLVNDYNIFEYSGEWDTTCKGKFEITTSILIVDKKVTKGFFNIRIRKNFSTIENYLLDGDCTERDISDKNKSFTLKYNGKEYK